MKSMNCLLCFVVLLLQCCSDYDVENPVDNGTKRFFGSIEQPTKVAVNDGALGWEQGDRVGIFNLADDNTVSDVNIEYRALTDGLTTTFTPEGDNIRNGIKYYAYYPYRSNFPALNGYAAKAVNDNPRECYFAVNGTQVFYVTDGIHNGRSNQQVFLAGEGVDDGSGNVALRFTPLMPILEIGLTGNTAISSIEISFHDATKATGCLSGKGVVNLTDGNVTVSNYNTPTFVKAVFRNASDGSSASLQLSDREQRLKIVTCDFAATGGLTVKFTRASDGMVFTKDIWLTVAEEKTTSYVDDASGRKRKHIYQPIKAITNNDFSNIHPRLLFRAGEEEALRRNIAANVSWTKLHEIILAESDVICTEEPKTYNVVGGRLHTTACEVVRRVLYLSYSYRMTGLAKYLERAEEEMLAVAAFPDWHPYHFLDVAEMSFAVAFGYDWLYNDLSTSTRTTLCNAIRDMGLLPSENGTDYELRWMQMENNWAQVCHGSLAIAALAIISEEPEIANRILERSKQYITIPMTAEYAPMGAYPEGIGYWSYGTTLNVIFLAALENYFGTSVSTPLKNTQGFMQTGGYYAQLVTNTLNTFGFSDNSTAALKLQPVLLWFYNQTKDPTLLYHQAKLIDKYTSAATDYGNGRSYSSIIYEGSGGRHLPLMVLWGAGTGAEVAADLGAGTAPSNLFYISQGKNPICVMRSGWNTNDTYVGFKVGSPSCAHGHMDVGTFQYEYGGARFAVDLGSDSYGAVALANLGGSMFDMEESSIRWTVLHRYNNFVHNTITINNQHQVIGAKSEFYSYSDKTDQMYAVADLTPNYAGQAESVKRAVAFYDRSFVVVEDLIAASAETDADVVWNMTTKAGVGDLVFDTSSNIITIKGKNSAGQVRVLKIKVVLSNAAATPDGISVTRTAVNDVLNLGYETTAAGHYFIRIAYKVAKGQTQRMKCYLLPDGVDTNITRPDLIDAYNASIENFDYAAYGKE